MKTECKLTFKAADTIETKGSTQKWPIPVNFDGPYFQNVNRVDYFGQPEVLSK
jgi:hypothetical protein